MEKRFGFLRAGRRVCALLIGLLALGAASPGAAGTGTAMDGVEEASVPGNWPAPPFWLPPPAGSDRDTVRDALAARPDGSASEPLAGPVALPFFAINPCRLADTRPSGGFTGAFGPPYMPAAVLRNFPIAGQCGIPTTARAVSFNFTVTNTLGAGFLLVFPAGNPVPPVSTLTYLGAQTISNAAIVALGAGGAISAAPGVSGFDLIIDVNGYYAPTGIVASLGGLTGDVTLAAGANISITPSGNTLTVAAPLTGLNAGNVTSGVLGISFGGTGSSTAAGARLALGAAARGANADIASLSGLTTPLSVAQGGTGSATPSGSVYQARVSGTCAAGAFVVGVNSNGTVVCGSPTVDPRPGFSLSSVDRSVGGGVSVTIGTDGRGLISYLDVTLGLLKSAHCNDLACTSVSTATLDSGGTDDGSSIVIGVDGLGLILYSQDGKRLKVAHCNDVACTSATSAILAAFPYGLGAGSITIGADGLGIVTFQNDLFLDVARCRNTLCSSLFPPVHVDGASAWGGKSITVGVDGLPMISYADFGTAALKVGRCNDLACLSVTRTTLTGPASVHSSSMTVGADGLGLISFIDSSERALKVAHCNDIGCTSASVSTLHTFGNSGTSTSITIGADGLGLVAFAGTETGVAHCNNVACTTAAIARLGTHVSASASLTIGTDGQGLMTYFDAVDGDLKTAHCANPFCTPFVRRR